MGSTSKEGRKEIENKETSYCQLRCYSVERTAETSRNQITSIIIELNSTLI
jgi:hypothetical protein